jgi:ribonuclease D
MSFLRTHRRELAARQVDPSLGRAPPPSVTGPRRPRKSLEGGLFRILPAVTRWVRTPEALVDLARTLAQGRVLALDTESDSLYHHFDKVCLVQVATEGGEGVLVDPLALRDLSPLASVLADPHIEKVLHGADYDVATLKRDYGFSFAGIFDTMIAARFLGRAEIGLAAVARDELGVALSKESQKDDWSRRPLTPKQERYALADVRHLIDLGARLKEQLDERGRLEWVLEECEAVAAVEPLQRRRDPDAFLAIKGARRLPPRGLAALRELVAWRERRAEATDRPPFRILGGDALLKLAQHGAASPADLRRIPGILPRLRDQSEEILAALRRAADLPEADLPALPRPVRPVASEPVLRRIERLKAWRRARAAQLGVEVAVVLPQRLIDRLAERSPRDEADLASVPGLRRWRVSTFGDEILAAVAGYDSRA